jgi:hypothetical protein
VWRSGLLHDSADRAGREAAAPPSHPRLAVLLRDLQLEWFKFQRGNHRVLLFGPFLPVRVDRVR